MALETSIKVTVAVGTLFALATLPTAQAGDRAAWFQSLRIPGTKASCCDMADCHRTEADWRAGNWWVLIDKKWREVPQSSVLSHPASLDGSAYVCVGAPAWSIGGGDPPIYCFVPPNWPS